MADTTYLNLPTEGRDKVCAALQTILANTIYLHDLYKKYHWHVQGEDFYQYHKLFDKHAAEQYPLIDDIAERIRTLGSDVEGLPAEVAAATTVSEPSEPKGQSEAMVHNLLKVHEAYLKDVRSALKLAAKLEDEGTNDLLASQVLRTQELQVWFLRSSLPRTA